MFVWLQVLFFIVTNAPSLIKSIKELIDIFKDDKQVAKSVLSDLKSAKQNPQVGGDPKKQMADIIAGYKSGERKTS